MMQIAGVDGCRAGWMTIWRETGEAAFRFHVFATLAELESALPELAALAIDMPIGLPDMILGSGRAPEKQVRPLLGQRQSSVFSIPARAAVEADDYREACRLAMLASDPPRKVAKQGFNLFPKIRELDLFLRARHRLWIAWWRRIPNLCSGASRVSRWPIPRSCRTVVQSASACWPKRAFRRRFSLHPRLPARVPMISSMPWPVG